MSRFSIACSDIELVALVIRIGVKGTSALELATELDTHPNCDPRAIYAGHGGDPCGRKGRGSKWTPIYR